MTTSGPSVVAEADRLSVHIITSSAMAMTAINGNEDGLSEFMIDLADGFKRPHSRHAEFGYRASRMTTR